MLTKIAAALFIFSVLFIIGVGIFALVMYIKKGNNKKNYK